MTRVSFYLLQAEAANRDGFVCRLLERIHAQGQNVYVHLPDATAQTQLNEKLWTFKPDSFVPHDLEVQDNTSAIVIGAGAALPAQRDVLLNLAAAELTPPDFFSSFARTLEVVAGSAQDKAAARARYSFYRDRGYALETHSIA